MCILQMICFSQSLNELLKTVAPDQGMNLQSHVPSVFLLDQLHSDFQSLLEGRAGRVGGQLSVGGALRRGLEEYENEESGSESLFR